ncbi:class I SAM-dependent methyltransferase [Paenibacillus sp. NPDC056579]|uniref:class I SAM-dependent methyltransferase n=1 Tax=Paenibacillus sp. NPDC056579 TaxID=3345871 RepID=UPI003691B6B0
MNNETKASLAKAYDADAAKRAAVVPAEWKVQERERFISKLREEGKTAVLEIGAGTGKDSEYFRSEGFSITCIDLSEEMVKHCKAKGLDAAVMDFYNLQFPDRSFDAVYALNCLLHVPKAELGQVLDEIKRVMKEDGLLYMGVYGGKDSEEIWEDDWCEPKRLFSMYTDESVQEAVRVHMDIEYFQTVPLETGKPHFQSLHLRKVK